MNLIHSIRNDFCHSLVPRAFSEADIVKKCDQFRIAPGPYQDEDKPVYAIVTLLGARFQESPARQRFVTASLITAINLFQTMVYAYEEFANLIANIESITSKSKERYAAWMKDFLAELSAKFREMSGHSPQ
jgi:hypothetical protein